MSPIHNVVVDHSLTNEQIARLVEKLGRYYHSEYVAKCKPWIRLTPFADWLRRELINRGILLEGGETGNDQQTTAPLYREPNAASDDGSIA